MRERAGQLSEGTSCHLSWCNKGEFSEVQLRHCKLEEIGGQEKQENGEKTHINRRVLPAGNVCTFRTLDPKTKKGYFFHQEVRKEGIC